MYNIEKNVPQPAKIKRGRLTKYPYSNMQVGDSFFISTNEPVRAKVNVLSSAYTWGKRNMRGFKITAKIERDGVRVWRIK